ncbi:MAG TPA: hypothetical protein VHS03_05910 [Gaiellaceae bacterium]|nr:hypothetical protein [Gaiellaceae bacterium]
MLGLLALVSTGLATAGNGAPIQGSQPGKITKVGQSQPGQTTAPRAVHALGYRLGATLTPASSSSTASGHWDGILVHVVGVVRNGTMPSIPGCSVRAPKAGGPGQAPPRASGVPHQIKCGSAVPPFSIPGSGNRWVLGWRLTYSNLSSAVTGTDMRIQLPGQAPAAANVSTLCGACASRASGHLNVTDDQANDLLKGYGSIVVRTSSSPNGEISGPIVQVTAKAKTATG